MLTPTDSEPSEALVREVHNTFPHEYLHDHRGCEAVARFAHEHAAAQVAKERERLRALIDRVPSDAWASAARLAAPETPLEQLGALVADLRGTP